MYRILTKLHTLSEGNYVFHKEDGEIYGTESLDEAKEKALEILRRVGYKDLKIVEDIDYYIKPVQIEDKPISQKDIEDLERLLGRVGSDDLWLGRAGEYKTELYWGKKPEPEQQYYEVHLMTNTEEVTFEVSDWLNISEGDSIETKIYNNLQVPFTSLHFIINGIETAPVPEWIEYDENEQIIKLKELNKELFTEDNLLYIRLFFDDRMQ